MFNNFNKTVLKHSNVEIIRFWEILIKTVVKIHFQSFVGAMTSNFQINLKVLM